MYIQPGTAVLQAAETVTFFTPRHCCKVALESATPLQKGAVDAGYSTGDYPTRPCCTTTALGPALQSTCVFVIGEEGREVKCRQG